MRHIYEFNWNDKTLTEIVAHTVKNPFHKATVDYDEDFKPITKDVKEPELYIVKDRGSYIMSASKKSLYLNPKDKESKSQKVVYAKGHNPNKDEDYWVDGDDYGIRFPVDWVIDAIGKQQNFLIIITENSVSYKLAN